MSDPGLNPIFVMSFARPDYLGRVLESLKAQRGCGIEHRAVHLFQDGAVNPFSGRRYASDDVGDECVAVFRRVFPGGIVHQAETNLGVALNFERAERLAFEQIGAEAAIFLEDDLVLNEHYIATLDLLTRQFAADDRVAYVSAYGDHTKDLAYQRANANRLTVMTHNWGFALFRRQWLAMRERVLQYLDLVRDKDYRDRDPEAIKALFESWGYGYPAISQDAAKTIAACAIGAVKVNTLVCHGAYIGEQGLHMNERLFRERGYGKTEVYPAFVGAFEPLTGALCESLMRELGGWANAKPGNKTKSEEKPANRGEDVDSTVNSLLQMVDPKLGQAMSSDLITIVYQAILSRAPDQGGLEAYGRLYRDRPLPEAIARTIRGLLNSGEFHRNWVIRS